MGLQQSRCLLPQTCGRHRSSGCAYVMRSGPCTRSPLLPAVRAWPFCLHLYSSAAAQMQCCTSIAPVALICGMLVNFNMLSTDTAHHLLQVACDSLVPSNHNQVIQLVLGIICLKNGKIIISSRYAKRLTYTLIPLLVGNLDHALIQIGRRFSLQCDRYHDACPFCIIINICLNKPSW